MDKRLHKLDDLQVRDAIRVDAPYENPDVLIVGMGSTGGTIDQARLVMEQDGLTTNHITIRQLYPFPTEAFQAYAGRAKKIVVLENNATGQLANQIKLNVGCADKIESITKYDGTPFLPSEVYKQSKELVSNGNI